MSRSDYSDDIEDNWAHICWRGAVSSATRGARGQKLLREMTDAMDAMPIKRLIKNELALDGEFCALGVLGHARAIDMKGLDPDDAQAVSAVFDIAPCLAQEIVYQNDEAHHVQWSVDGRRLVETPEQRWIRMRKWVGSQIKAKSPDDSTEAIAPTENPPQSILRNCT